MKYCEIFPCYETPKSLLVYYYHSFSPAHPVQKTGMDERIHLRRVLLDYHRSGKSKKEATRAMHVQFGLRTPSRHWFEHWWNLFDNGVFSLDDEPRSGRPTVHNSNVVLDALAKEPTSSAHKLEKTTGVPRTTVRRILHQAGMAPKKPHLVPHQLTAHQQQQRKDICEANLNQPHLTTVLNTLICQDEKWIYYSNPAHNQIWVSAGAPPPTRPKRDIHSKKNMISFWFSKHGVVHWQLIPDNTTINAKTVVQELQVVKTKASILSPRLANPFLLWDNAHPHAAKVTRAALDRIGYKSIQHPPYSPDISPCDYHIFRSLQNYCDGKNFTSRQDVETAVNNWIRSQPGEFWQRGIDSLPARWTQVINNNGNYIVD